MRIPLERWTIDFVPPRVVVSVYLLVTGLLLALAVIALGVAFLAAGMVSGGFKLLSDVVFLTPPPSPGDIHLRLPDYIFAGWAVMLFFLAATVLMWVRMPGRWVAAALAALVGGCAWWALVYGLLSPPHHPPLVSAAVLVAVTAVVTLGPLVATLQRAPTRGRSSAGDRGLGLAEGPPSPDRS